jgi:hypothetical protein
LVIGGVAIVRLAVDRHGPIGGDGDAVQQLLEVGAVVLVVAEGDARRPARLLGGGLRGVGAAEGDGGGVLMQLSQVNGELPDGSQHQGGQQAGTVGPLQMVKRPADPVVVEQGNLVGFQAEVLGDTPGHPGGEGIQRLAGQEQVGQQHG